MRVTSDGFCVSEQACYNEDTMKVTSDGFVYQCNSGKWYAADNMCVVPYSPLYSPHIFKLSYNVSVTMLSQGKSHGHPSVMYNYIDDNNFDYIMFRSVRKVKSKKKGKSTKKEARACIVFIIPLKKIQPAQIVI